MSHAHDGVAHKCGHAQLKHRPTLMEMPVEEGEKHLYQRSPIKSFRDYLFNEGQARHFSHMVEEDPNTAVDGWHQIRIYLEFKYSNQFIAANTGL